MSEVWPHMVATSSKAKKVPKSPMPALVGAGPLEQMSHQCPDGVTHRWQPRVAKPQECPRCKARLDK